MIRACQTAPKEEGKKVKGLTFLRVEKEVSRDGVEGMGKGKQILKKDQRSQVVIPMTRKKEGKRNEPERKSSDGKKRARRFLGKGRGGGGKRSSASKKTQPPRKGKVSLRKKGRNLPGHLPPKLRA